MLYRDQSSGRPARRADIDVEGMPEGIAAGGTVARKLLAGCKRQCRVLARRPGETASLTLDIAAPVMPVDVGPGPDGGGQMRTGPGTPGQN